MRRRATKAAWTEARPAAPAARTARPAGGLNPSDALGFDVDENPDGTLVPFNPNPDPRRALHRRRFILLGGAVRLAEYEKREAADREAIAKEQEATKQKVKTRLDITQTIAAAVEGTCVGCRNIDGVVQGNSATVHFATTLSCCTRTPA